MHTYYDITPKELSYKEDHKQKTYIL